MPATEQHQAGSRGGSDATPGEFFATVNAHREFWLCSSCLGLAAESQPLSIQFTDPKPATLSVCPQSLRVWNAGQVPPGLLAARNSWGSAAITLPALGTLSPLSPCQHPPPEHRQGDQRFDTVILLMQLLLKCSFKVTWNGQQ